MSDKMSEDGRHTGLDRLKQVIDTYGADPGRWPDAERAALRELAAGNREAAA